VGEKECRQRRKSNPVPNSNLHLRRKETHGAERKVPPVPGRGRGRHQGGPKRKAEISGQVGAQDASDKVLGKPGDARMGGVKKTEEGAKPGRGT